VRTDLNKKKSYWKIGSRTGQVNWTYICTWQALWIDSPHQPMAERGTNNASGAIKWMHAFPIYFCQRVQKWPLSPGELRMAPLEEDCTKPTERRRAVGAAQWVKKSAQDQWLSCLRTASAQSARGVSEQSNNANGCPLES